MLKLLRVVVNNSNNMFKQRPETGFGVSLALSVSLNIALSFGVVARFECSFAVFGSALNQLLMSCSVSEY